MEELKTWNDLNPEQQDQAKKAMAKSRRTMAFSVIKFLVGLFAANLFTQVVGFYIIGDLTSPLWPYYCFMSAGLNTFFLARYFHSLMKANGDRLKNELLKISKQ